MIDSTLTSALVTGASSGIGAATVRAFTSEGLKVWAMARRRDRLEQLAAETGCIPLVADVTDGTALAAALDNVAPDVLVNNAGLGAGITGLLDASRSDLERTIGTNVLALLDVCRLVLPGMVDRGRGHVVNIGSVGAFYPVQSVVYGGSKGAVRLISQNLRIELRGARVRVTEICPGRVSTEFMNVAIPASKSSQYPAKTPIRELTPEDVAAAIVYAVKAPTHVNISTIELQPIEQTYGGMSFDPIDWPEV